MTGRDKVLVTGANGFLGRALSGALGQQGIDVVGGIRSSDSLVDPVPGVSYVSIGAISGGRDWEALFKDTDVVIHCAARVLAPREDGTKSFERLREVNRDGTLSLARQAAAQGVRRFVFISTVKVNGENTDNRPAFREDDPPAPTDPYGISKFEAEEGLKALAAASDMEMVIIRPPLVYGPGVRGNFRSLLKLASLPGPLPFGGLTNRRSLIFRDNLVDFILSAIRHPCAANKTFLVSDGEDVSTSYLLSMMRRTVGRRPMLLPLPVGVLRSLGRMLGQSGLVTRVFGSLQVDISQARDLLGWAPPYSLTQGLSETIKAENDQ